MKSLIYPTKTKKQENDDYSEPKRLGVILPFMPAGQKLTRAVWNFQRFSGNLPRTLKAEHLTKYHELIDELEEASGEDLSRFRIPQLMQVPGQVPACDPLFFETQVIALKCFTKTLRR